MAPAGAGERSTRAGVTLPGGTLAQGAATSPATSRGGVPSPSVASGAFTSVRHRRIVIRMPRMQVYLPDDLHQAVKDRNLPASELLQQAVRVELRRLDLLAETDRYLAELLGEVGEPTGEETARARALARRLTRDADRAAG